MSNDHESLTDRRAWWILGGLSLILLGLLAISAGVLSSEDGTRHVAPERSSPALELPRSTG